MTITTAAEHVTTIIEDPKLGKYPWTFSCSCGHSYGGSHSSRDLIESAAERHRLNPTAEKAHALARRMREGNLTESEEHALTRALLHASHIVDGDAISHRGQISVVAETAVKSLVQALRGEA